MGKFSRTFPKFCSTFALAFGKWCSQMPPCDIERTIASALPTATYGYVWAPGEGGDFLFINMRKLSIARTCIEWSLAYLTEY